MSIRSKVEEKETAAVVVQEERKELSPAQKLKNAVNAQSAAFKTVLPKSVDHDRFSRLVLSAVKSTPDLMKCFQTEGGQVSIFLAAMQAASLGLEPNTPTQECWLLPRNAKVPGTKDKYRTECQLNIGYRGYIKLIRNGGGIETIYAEVVREGEDFYYERGLKEDKLRHVPTGGDDGKITHAYAVVRYLNGGYAFIVLDEAAIHARRAMSDGWKNERSRPYNPWTTSYPAMCRKSAIRALVPFLELTAEAARAVANDEQSFTKDEDGLILATETDWTLNAIEASAVDSETGEVNPDVVADTTDVKEQQDDPQNTEQEVAEPAKENPIEVLAVVLRENDILGPDRLKKVGEATGSQPRKWEDVTEEQAQKTIKFIESRLV